MAINLVSSIMQSLLTPDMIAKIASLLGLDRSVAEKAIAAGIPTILAGLAGRASTPDGASQLSNVLAQQSPISPDQLQSAASGSSGGGLLSSLIGGSDMNAIAGAIGNFAGINSSTGKSLLAMLGPLVAGALGQQQRSAGLDASGLASLLTSQKDQIAAAMPAGVAKMLGGTELLDNLGSGVRRTADAASAAGGRFAGMTEDALVRTGQAVPSSGRTWPYWLGAAAVLLGLGLYFLPSHETPRLAEGTNPPATQSGTVGSRGPSVTAAELTRDLASSVTNARTALLGITDPATARAALPRLQQATAQIDRISTLAEQLPPTARQGIAASVKPTMTMLDELFDKVLSTPELATVAKPTIDALRSKLQALSQA